MTERFFVHLIYASFQFVSLFCLALLPAVRSLMAISQTLKVEDQGRRLDHYLYSVYPQLLKGHVQKAIRKKQILINQKKTSANYRLCPHDVLKVPMHFVNRDINQKHANSQALTANQVQLGGVLVDNQEFLVVNKPSGLAVQGGSGIKVSMDDLVRSAYGSNLKMAHRLDRGTSGCLVFAKHYQALQRLHEAFRHRSVYKTYLAVLTGQWSRQPAVSVNIGLKVAVRNGQKHVFADSTSNAGHSTTFYLIKQTDHHAWVRAVPSGGHLHQIRAHASALGLPILGDMKYGDGQSNEFTCAKSIFLHAETITLPYGQDHSEEDVCYAPLPKEKLQWLSDHYLMT
ncbi:RluA family pseudouridine synthase [Gammaproteobacteria bacterium]|nr:RluA family pseudouridine synthase [Gammaproteobacteria bacterium]